MPLVGLEKLAAALPPPLRPLLQLHTFVVLAPDGGGEAWLFDFLPESPTAPATAARLLTGQAVEGAARQRRLPAGRLPPASSVSQVAVLSRCDAVAVASSFSEAWGPSLSLAGRNCRHHTAALVAALLAAEHGAGGAP
ncbi:MAG: hypothetical protein J3K34DRAFT_435221 [Monoraphidium minutum]|nr:MAG: hypothetical protein J3K34DRAFT_435221 [Monoraphidium minutum]